MQPRKAVPVDRAGWCAKKGTGLLECARVQSPSWHSFCTKKSQEVRAPPASVYVPFIRPGGAVQKRPPVATGPGSSPSAKGEDCRMLRDCAHCHRPFEPQDLAREESKGMEAERKALGLRGVLFRYYVCPECGYSDI